MSAIALLIPLALLFFIGIVGILVWSVKSGQFDDLESPATEILLDSDTPTNPSKPTIQKCWQRGHRSYADHP